ncbi:hypothetical protein BG261_04315 [Floricoccus tropicus]|uniref:S-adenosyl-L-methionine-dependent methyltransferase n=1 Tax=Floricoccus tropicus TaxID=1859473 RepID=A0A1E8GLJ0_9LACT|nr:class I SAM-dependent methyltransferase [Floricoccus tropicus]OFI49102.1 hypothetical protein BG261_04315 [Floricoccus tropicus]
MKKKPIDVSMLAMPMSRSRYGDDPYSTKLVEKFEDLDEFKDLQKFIGNSDSNNEWVFRSVIAKDKCVIKWLKKHATEFEQLLIVSVGLDTKADALGCLQDKESYGLDICKDDILNIYEYAGIKTKTKILQCNLEKDVNDELLANLIEEGFDIKKKTCVLWIGASFYISKESIDHTLDFFDKNINISHFVIDFMNKSVFQPPRNETVRLQLEALQGSELVWKSFYSYEEIQNLYRKHGFENIEIIFHGEAEYEAYREVTLEDDMMFTSFAIR